jgi:uncharacterized damage-inducible protein DinB
MDPTADRNPALEEPRQPESPLTKELLRLVDQSVWANRQWIEYVYSQPDPETRPRELLSHVVVSEEVWFDRIEGEPEIQTTFAIRSKAELLLRLEENRRTFQRLIAERLEDVVHFRRASGEEYDARGVDVLHQVLTHGYHHRGQIAAHYAQKGASYPNTDHINYLIENRL